MNWLTRPFCQQLCGIHKIRLDWLKCIDRLGGGWQVKFGLPDISHNDGMFIFIAYYFIYFIFCFNRESVQLTVTKSSTYVSTTQSTNQFYGCIQYNPYRRRRDGKFTGRASSRRRRKPIYLRVLSTLGGIKELYTGFQATFILTYQISTIFARLISNPDRPRERWVKVYAQCSFYFI